MINWVHHDEPERLNQLLTDFFAPALPTENRSAPSEHAGRWRSSAEATIYSYSHRPLRS